MISEHILKRQGQLGKRKASDHGSMEAAITNEIESEQILSLSHRLRLPKDFQDHQSFHLLNTNQIKKYIQYARQAINPRLTSQAARVLQKLYLTLRAQATLGDALPVTTRHLESLIRLSQARAKMELRLEVTEEDANDVVDLLHESLLDAFTVEDGVLDLKGRKGGISVNKQVKALVGALSKRSRDTGNTIFRHMDIAEIAGVVFKTIAVDLENLIGVYRYPYDDKICLHLNLDVMRTECYLLLKGSRIYQLQV